MDPVAVVHTGRVPGRGGVLGDHGKWKAKALVLLSLKLEKLLKSGKSAFPT